MTGMSSRTRSFRSFFSLPNRVGEWDDPFGQKVLRPSLTPKALAVVREDAQGVVTRPHPRHGLLSVVVVTLFFSVRSTFHIFFTPSRLFL